MIGPVFSFLGEYNYKDHFLAKFSNAPKIQKPESSTAIFEDPQIG